MARFHIVRGPPREDFNSSLTEGDALHRKPVEFQVAESEHSSDQHQTLQFIVEGLEREDGGGQNWLFHGSCISEDQRFNNVQAKGFLSFETEVSSGWLDL